MENGEVVNHLLIKLRVLTLYMLQIERLRTSDLSLADSNVSFQSASVRRKVSVKILSLPHLKDIKSLLRSFDTGKRHGTESRAHTVGPIYLAQLHASND